MKKKKITTVLFFTVLFSCLLMPGCKTDSDSPNPVIGGTPYVPADAQGKLIILQAYGNAGDEPPAGVSHSFVELYNITDEPIGLDGISLYFANGIRGENVTADDPWERIDLSGNTIPAESSFLILGDKHSGWSAARYKIPDSSGDINNSNLSLSRRGFKVALIQSTGPLYVQDPFTARSGGPISYYIDMVGAVNNPTASPPDHIFGYERAPARCSASEAVRRMDLRDLDNNSIDFIAAKYGNDGQMTEDELNDRKPHNSSNPWRPFGEPEENTIIKPGTQDPLAGSLLILQAYGPNSSAAGASHPFVELYNNSEPLSPPINLNGISLYFADGVRGSTQDGPWKRIPLSGNIPAGKSFLIMGPNTSSSARLQLPDGYGDMNEPAFTLSNRAYKVAIIHSSLKLTAQNPFNMGSGAKAQGYIDMVGAVNNPALDSIYGFETAPALGSASQAVRRKTPLTNTNDNSTEYEPARYGSKNDENEGTIITESLTNAQIAVRRPRNSTETLPSGHPFATVPGESQKLMILQANTYGNANSPLGSGFPKSLVELYNNSGSSIDLSADNYYLHIGDATGWQQPIKLTGSVDSKKSFLIVSNDIDEVSKDKHRADLPAADQTATFKISNNEFMIAVLRNQSSKLASGYNPFTAGLGANYIDMLGVQRGGQPDRIVNGFEFAAFLKQSRPRVPRRVSLVDTDNNAVDFADVDYRAEANFADNELYKVWPRNSVYGTWNPITGLPEIHPTVP